MDKKLLVKFANEHRLNADTVAKFASDVFEAGQKNGFYQVLRLIGDGWAELNDVAVDELSYDRVLLLDMIVNTFKAASPRAFIRKRLEELRGRDVKAKLELAGIEARSQALLQFINKGEEESEVLSELLKEIELWTSPGFTPPPMPCSRRSWTRRGAQAPSTTCTRRFSSA